MARALRYPFEGERLHLGYAGLLGKLSGNARLTGVQLNVANALWGPNDFNQTFLDVNRNAYAQTVVAPYAVRAKEGAPVAMPVTWAMVESADRRPNGVTIRNVWEWLERHDDPWAEMERQRRPLPQLAEAERPDRSGRRKGVKKSERRRP